MTTPLVFRTFPEGDTIALFPTIPATQPGEDCESYMHIGQHGAATPDLVRFTHQATQAQANELMQELVTIGYDDLKVYKRITWQMHQTRREEAYRLDHIRA
jgi:hypothetical protein